MLEPVTTGPSKSLGQVTTGLVESAKLDQLEAGITTDSHTEAGLSTVTQLGHGNRRKRKMQAIQEMHSGVDHCLCGVHADSNSSAVVQCKRNGCETKWVCHIIT